MNTYVIINPQITLFFNSRNYYSISYINLKDPRFKYIQYNQEDQSSDLTTHINASL